MYIHIKSRLRNNTIFYKVFRQLRNRYHILRYGLKSVHPTCYVSSGCLVSNDLVAGEYTFIADGCRIGPKVRIGKYVMFGPKVAIIGADHRFDQPGTPMIFSGRPELHPTIIEDDVWIGFAAIIMAGVHVGRGAIVAANAIVTHNIPAYEIYGGVPARKIGVRFSKDEERHLHDLMLQQPAREGVFCNLK